MKNKNPHDLTEDEIAYLRTASGVPDEVKGYLSRQHENIGTKVSAYRKVAAAARAECDALIAVRDLEVLHGELTTVRETKAQLLAAKAQSDALKAVVAEKDAEIMRRTAAPALAVHSGRG